MVQAGYDLAGRLPGHLPADVDTAADHALVHSYGGFACGPTGFVEVVADALVALGHDPRGSTGVPARRGSTCGAR
ncbi:hypothetical protein [Saccharothrix lopnurensis]|uniref:Uncharacterized protein n=1 Tax=Saccharothrix lopnurensis TaxID=1670621 RepID=A0ABW1NX08_9PSEU